MTDELADELEQIKSDTEAETAQIVDVRDAGSKIVVDCELPSGTTFSEKFNKPIEWTNGNAFVRLMESFDLEPDEVGELIDKEVPIEKSTGRTELKFDIDKDNLIANTTL